MEGKTFFSYSRKDSVFVDKLAEDLESRGIETWVDRGDIVAGGGWREQIVEAIKTCSVFFIVLSLDSVDSGNVNRELTLAEKHKKTIIPIIHQSAEIPDSMAYQLVGLQQLDFSTGSYDDNLKSLLKALSQFDTTIHEPGEMVEDASIDSQVAVPGQKSGSAQVPQWVWVVGGVVLLIVIFLGFSSIFRGDDPTPTPATTTVTAVVADQSAETESPPAETSTPTEEMTPTETPIPLTPTSTSTPTGTPIPTALVELDQPRGEVNVPMRLVADCLIGEDGVYAENNCDLSLGSDDLQNAFYMDKYPVTNEQFASYLNLIGAENTRVIEAWFDFDHKDSKLNYENASWVVADQYLNYPIVAVSWTGANQFCAEFSAKLPVVAEWEQAAGGNLGYLYPWGNDINLSYANYQDQGVESVLVKTENVSIFGVWGMAGNVWEWTKDFRQDTEAVLKGGSYISNSYQLRIDQQIYVSMDEQTGEYGFRCVQNAAP